jgi:hypothetical protein
MPEESDGSGFTVCASLRKVAPNDIHLALLEDAVHRVHRITIDATRSLQVVGADPGKRELLVYANADTGACVRYTVAQWRDDMRLVYGVLTRDDERCVGPCQKKNIVAYMYVRCIAYVGNSW